MSMPLNWIRGLILTRINSRNQTKSNKSGWRNVSPDLRIAKLDKPIYKADAKKREITTLNSGRTTNLAFAKQVLKLLPRIFEFKKSRILWIGDSHAVFMRSGLRRPFGRNKPINSLLYWLGPRLMFSISQSGFSLSLFVQTFIRLWKPRIVIITLGEIDVRMFLSNPNLRKTRWIVDYLSRVLELCEKLHLNEIYLLTSIPVSNLPTLDPIERVGSTNERLEGFNWLQSQIKLGLSTNKNFSKIHLLDLRECLSGPDGTLSSNLSDDGIHVNVAGAWQTWKAISNQILKPPSGP